MRSRYAPGDRHSGLKPITTTGQYMSQRVVELEAHAESSAVSCAGRTPMMPVKVQWTVTTATCAASENSSVPEMGVEPRWTCTVEAVTVPGSIGSLKTTTIVELSGTSRLPDDGYVRTTVGECLSGTIWMKCRGFSPPL